MLIKFKVDVDSLNQLYWLLFMSPSLIWAYQVHLLYLAGRWPQESFVTLNSMAGYNIVQLHIVNCSVQYYPVRGVLFQVKIITNSQFPGKINFSSRPQWKTCKSQFPVITNAHSQFPEKINLVSQFPVKKNVHSQFPVKKYWFYFPIPVIVLWNPVSQWMKMPIPDPVEYHCSQFPVKILIDSQSRK